MIREQAGDDFDRVKELRDQTLRPLAEKLFDAMESYRSQTLPKSAFGRALRYALGRLFPMAILADESVCCPLPYFFSQPNRVLSGMPFSLANALVDAYWPILAS